MRIDAHQHYWQPARGDYGWLTPALGALCRDYAPADLAPALARHNIDGTVLVQAAPTLAETEFLLGVAHACPSVLGVVGWVDFEAADAAQHIERLAKNPLLKSLRPMVQDIADRDWLARPSLDAAFDAVIACGLLFDALVKPQHLGALRRRLSRHPRLSVVIDHGAKPDIAAGAFEGWAADMEKIATESNACCKLSGLVTEAAPGWTVDTLRPYVTHLLACFGPERLMFGSDWPVLTLNGDYDGWISAVDSLTSGLTEPQKAALFGGTAARFYSLSPRS